MQSKPAQWTILGLAAITAAILYAGQPNDPVIEAARRAADAFAQSLPDYVVKRTTTRYLGTRRVASGGTSFFGSPETVRSWQKSDTVSGDVTAAHGTETYANIQVNGKLAKQLPGDGVWSSGEFSIILAGILSPKSAAQFTNQRPDPIGNRPSWHYDFAVDQTHSGWQLEASHVFGASFVQRWSPAYGGSIWIDAETGQVLRFAISAREVPAAFPMDAVETSVDYDFVPIGDEKYVLPTHSETVTCARYQCYKNVTVFQDYHKFGADTSIAYDSGQK